LPDSAVQKYSMAIARPEAKARLAAEKLESASEAGQIPDQKYRLP
jgi:hypothetical protein